MKLLVGTVVLAVAVTSAAPPTSTRRADADPAFAPGGRVVEFTRPASPDRLAVDLRGRVVAPVPPSVSPDGRYVAVGDARGVAILDTATNVRRPLGKVGWVEWSRTSRTLAYVGENGIGIAAGDGSGAHAIRVDLPPCTSDHCSTIVDDPVPSPDGRRVAFAWANVPGDVHNPQSSLAIVRASGGKPVDVGGGDICAPESSIDWSPDGRWIAYWGYDCYDDRAFGNVIVRADGAFYKGDTGSSFGAWTPRGHTFAFDTRKGLGLVTPPSKARTVVAGARSSAFAPDGRRIAIERAGVIEVGVVGGRFRTIARGSTPSWSDTVELIAYAVRACGPRQGIHVVRPDGRGDRRLTSTCTIRATRRGRVAGTPYADEVFAKDRLRQQISCGRGRDLVHADAVDVVAPDCERRD